MSGEYLRKLTLFANLTPQELKRVEELARVVMFPKGVPLIKQGEEPSRLYLLKTGTVRLFRVTADGRQITTQIAGANTFIGLEALLADQPYGLTAEGLETCCALEFTRPAAEQLFLENPVIAFKAIQSLSRNVSDTVESLLTHRLLNAQGRLLYALERLAETHGRKEESDTMIDLPVTHQDLANLSGLSRQTVSELMSDLKAAGVIAVVNRRIRLTERFPWGSSGVE
jgi:CRP-like cAMP-binding protein